MLMELLFWWKYAGTRKTSVLLFVDNSMQIFLRYISLRIWEDVYHTYQSHCHTPLKKIIKMSKWEFPRALDFEPWCQSRAAVFEYMPFVRVLENITFCSLFANPFHDFNHHSNQHQPPLPLLIVDMRSSASSLSLSVSRACNVCVSLSLSLSLSL